MMWRVPLQVEKSLLRSAPGRIPPGQGCPPLLHRVYDKPLEAVSPWTGRKGQSLG